MVSERRIETVQVSSPEAQDWNQVNNAETILGNKRCIQIG